MDRSVRNTREISVRNKSLHQQSLSAEYLLGRGTNVLHGRRRWPLGTRSQGRLSSSYGGHVAYAGVTRIRRTYGTGGNKIDGGNAGYVGDGQFLSGNYDEYIDDIGFEVDKGNSSAVHGCSPTVNVYPPRGARHQESNDGQQSDIQQTQRVGQQISRVGGLQAQIDNRQPEYVIMQAQAGELAVAAPTGGADEQSMTGKGTIDLNQVGQVIATSPTAGSHDSTSDDSDKEE